MPGRTVRLFLVDGSPTGLITAEIMNWTGHVLVGPRARLAEVLEREESTRTGVYLLVGDEPTSASKSKVYVGEGDNVGKRITQHNSDESKDFWTRLCLITSKDQNLTKAHARYLEGSLIGLIKKANRATLSNNTAPEPGLLPESDRADMEFFISQIEIVLPVLGFEFLRSQTRLVAEPVILQPPRGESPPRLAETSKTAENEFLELQLKDRKFGVDATAFELDGEIVVTKDSTARADNDPAMNSYAGLRDQLLADGRLVPSENPHLLRFAEDVPFKSPSAASAVILNRNDNGRRSWKIKGSSQTLADWQDSRLQPIK